MDSGGRTGTVVHLPWLWIATSIGVLILSIALLTFFLDRSAPPIQFRSKSAVSYAWTMMIKRDGHVLQTVRGRASGSEVVSVPWPTDSGSDRVLVQVDYDPVWADCVGGSTNRYVVPGSPPLAFAIQCEPPGAGNWPGPVGPM